MSSVKEPTGANLLVHAPTRDLDEIPAMVLRKRPARCFNTHLILRVADAQLNNSKSMPREDGRSMLADVVEWTKKFVQVKDSLSVLHDFLAAGRFHCDHLV